MIISRLLCPLVRLCTTTSWWLSSRLGWQERSIFHPLMSTRVSNSPQATQTARRLRTREVKWVWPYLLSAGARLISCGFSLYNGYHVCAGWEAIFLMFGIRDYVPTRTCLCSRICHKMAWKREPFLNTHPKMVLTARTHKLLCSNFRLSIQFQSPKRSENIHGF